MLKRAAVPIGCVSFVLLAAGCAEPSKPGAGGDLPITATSSAPDSSAVVPANPTAQAAVGKIVALISNSSGNFHAASVDFVVSSRGPAYHLLFPSETGEVADPTSLGVVVVAHGSFNRSGMKVAPNLVGQQSSDLQADQSFTYLYALVPADGSGLDWGLTDSAPNLGALGVVEHESL